MLQGDPGLGLAAHSVDDVIQRIEAEFGNDAQVLSVQALRGQDLAIYEVRAPTIPALGVA